MIPFIELLCKRAGPTAHQCFRVALSEEGRSKGRRFCEVEEAVAVVVMIGSLCRLPPALRLAGRSRPSGYFMQQLSQGGPNANGEGSGSKEAVERLVRAHPVVVFMKGSPAQPQCGFSNAVVQILRLHGVNDYRAYDVLQDPDLRQVKEASWTYLMTEQELKIIPTGLLFLKSTSLVNLWEVAIYYSRCIKVET
ncbi:glutaredoxin-related protein 5, mitochondrial isoform X2 [Crotalus tigris]|uniref:glutaredoxin-related protein 5, mitochondrial isoform X2 n=1 Tax=Crotalus tigris TaxID=88082 RepID=UPI00192F7CA0|nr:glutaredoxin-related protein 5, mitochondrial isoform X2 [Crotalus tigris]